MKSRSTWLATPTDSLAAAALFDAYRQFYGLAPDLPRAQAFIGERLARQESVVLLAGEPGAAALGFCQLYPSFCSLEAAPIACLYDLFVAPAGRRKGIGRALLEAAAAQARLRGWARLDLTTARTNAEAQSLYRALGWVQDEVFLSFSLHTPS
jgi:ribosomal protein S18 acetylase RimI-like enzyme